MRELVQTHARAGVQEESLLIPPLWEIRYAGNADRCGVALFFFLASGLSQSKRLLYPDEVGSLFNLFFSV